MVNLPSQPLTWGDDGSSLAWDSEYESWLVVHRRARKTQTEARTTTTITADDDLTLFFGRGHYAIDGLIKYVRSGSGSKLRVAFAFSTGFVNIVADGPSASSPFVPIEDTASAQNFGGTVSVVKSLIVTGFVQALSYGDLFLWWCLDGGSSQIELLEGSWLRAQRL